MLAGVKLPGIIFRLDQDFQDNGEITLMTLLSFSMDVFIFNFRILFNSNFLINVSFAAACTELAGLSIANGLFNGAIVTDRPVIVADLVGIENISTAFGMTVFFQGVCIMIGPLIAGRRDLNLYLHHDGSTNCV